MNLKINQYADDIATWRRGNGFETPTGISTTKQRDMMLGKLMLVVSEIGEAAEAVRKEDIENFKEELADTFIRLMDITASCGINIEQEIVNKMMKNIQRPFRHGKKCSL